MINPEKYNITVRLGVFDGDACYEARVRELPDIVEYADSAQEAYLLALDAVSTTFQIMADHGRAVPQPIDTESDYSGRVTLRLPRTLHRGLANRAEDEKVSLNQLLVGVLAAFRGFDAAMAESGTGWIDVIEDERDRKPSRNTTNVINLSERRYNTAEAVNW